MHAIRIDDVVGQGGGVADADFGARGFGYRGAGEGDAACGGFGLGDGCHDGLSVLAIVTLKFVAWMSARTSVYGLS